MKTLMGFLFCLALVLVTCGAVVYFGAPAECPCGPQCCCGQANQCWCGYME